MRGVKCVGGQDCHRNRMPRFERDCNVGPCSPVSTTTKHLPTSTKGPPSEINNDIGRGAGQNDVDTRDPYRSKTDRRPPPKRNLYSPDNEVNKVYGQTRGNTNVKTRPDQTTLDNGDKSVEDAPTDTSIMSTPFRFLTKWLGLGEADQTNEKEERSQDPEEKQNLDASGKHATRQHKWVYASPVWGDVRFILKNLFYFCFILFYFICIPHNPNTLPGILFYHFLFTMILYPHVSQSEHILMGTKLFG